MTKNKVLLPLILASLVFTAVNTAIAAPANELAELEKNDTKTEAIGFLGGAILGGLVAGPPGALVAATIGLISTTAKNEYEQTEVLTVHLNQTQRELIALQNQQGDLEARYQAAMREIETVNLQRVSLSNQISTLENNPECCSDTSLSLHFKTNSSSVEPHYMEAIEELASLSKEIDSPLILVSGFADPRGSDSENQRLSEQRVSSVVRALTAAGIRADYIQTNAFGETRSVSQDKNLETYFFDRRVNVQLRSTNSEMLTLSN